MQQKITSLDERSDGTEKRFWISLHSLFFSSLIKRDQFRKTISAGFITMAKVSFLQIVPNDTNHNTIKLFEKLFT